MNVETFEKLVLYRYRYVIAYSSLIGISLVALFYKLSDLVPGFSEAEALNVLAHQSAEGITQTVFNPIHSVLLWLSLNVFGNTPFAARLPGVILGLVALLLIFITLSVWHKKRIAMVATGLAATSSWFLHTSRIGTDEIVYPLSMLLLIVATTLFHHSDHKTWKRFLSLFVFLMALFTPLMFYMVLLFIYLYRKELKELWGTQSLAIKISMVITALISLAPLAFRFFQDFDLLLAWLGLPQSLPSLGEIISNINQTFGYVFWRAEPNAALHLGDLPMLDIFTVSMTALGLYHYEQHQHHLRTRFIISAFFVGLFVLSFVPQQAANSLLMPFIFIFAATGVITLLTQWYQIFPRNPIARVSALLPLSLLLLMVSFYHLERYMLAWPNTPETVAIYRPDGPALRHDIENEQPERANIVTTNSNEAAIKASVRDLDTPSEFINRSQLDGSAFSGLIYVTIEDQPIALEPYPEYEYVRSIASESERRPILFDIYRYQSDSQ